MEFRTHFDKIYIILLGLVAFTLPLGIALNNIAIGLLLLFWLFSGNLYSKIKTLLKNIYFWFFTSVYFIQFLGILYSTDVHDALTKLEKKAGLVIFPMVILSMPALKGKQLMYIIISFGICCLSLLAFAITKILIINGTLTKVPQLTEAIDDLIHIHHAYSGLYLVFLIVSLVYLIIRYWPQLNRYARLGLGFMILVLYVFLIILGARMAIFISFAVLGLQMLIFTVQTKNFKILIMLTFTIIIGVVGVLSLPATRSKLNEILFYKGVYHPFTPRLIQWQCSVEILDENDSWLYGVGTGDVKPLLQACYQDKKFWGHLYNYNFHNEYLEEMVRHGLIGLSLLLVGFLYPMVIAIKKKQFLYLYFILIFMLACISESVLNRQKGVIFYALFNALIASQFIFAPNKNHVLIDEASS